MNWITGGNWIVAGSLFGFLGVALGALGAHSLRSRLSPDLLNVFEVGVDYQIVHALGRLAVGLVVACADSRGRRLAMIIRPLRSTTTAGYWRESRMEPASRWARRSCPSRVASSVARRSAVAFAAAAITPSSSRPS